MTIPLNLDLFSVGVAVAGTTILGVVVFIENIHSITSRAFLYFCLVTSGWGIVNYLNYQVHDPVAILWLLRFLLFFAALQAFALFFLLFVFPKTDVVLPGYFKFALMPVAGLAAIVTLTDLTFSRIVSLSSTGQVSNPDRGPGIVLFGVVAVGFVIWGICILIAKIRKAQGVERRQFMSILWGIAIMFALIIAFNFILPAFFNKLQFIPYGAVFVLPFIIFTGYAILKQQLLGIKVIATEILIFTLSIATIFEVVFSATLMEKLLRSLVFVMVLITGILLIRSVRKEVSQREELQRLNAKIAADNQQLEELGRFKSQLLSLASHQIRSPLAAIKGFIALILGGAYGETGDKVKETLGKVQRSADDLINLINTLLDMRKVEEGKMEYVFEKTDLVPIVAGIVDGIMPLATEKKLALTADLPKGPVMVSVDKEKFKQVIQNLVDNAIKYTPAGFVKVQLVVDRAKAQIAVSDSGYGIPASLIPFLFEEFIRDERVKQQVRGTGLGLYIARKIAEAHGGTLSAESAGEGKGSTFRATIPVAPM